jgi:hypothetical protein
MKIRDIVIKYLKENNFDGLYNEEEDCACLIDNIGVCEDLYPDCIAGWKVSCDCDEHNWHITSDYTKVSEDISFSCPICGDREFKCLHDE